jgi:hypothetical protein
VPAAAEADGVELLEAVDPAVVALAATEVNETGFGVGVTVAVGVRPAAGTDISDPDTLTKGAGHYRQSNLAAGAGEQLEGQQPCSVPVSRQRRRPGIGDSCRRKAGRCLKTVQAKLRK